MLEVEVKIRIDIPTITTRLCSLGFVKGTTVYEKDLYFNGKQLDLTKVDKALRIRTHLDLETNITKYVLNFKGPKLDNSTMTREETQFEIPSLEQGLIVLKGLDFVEAGIVEKTRIHYVKNNIICCLDTVTDLGDFLEIEIMAEDLNGYKAALTTINNLLFDLGLDRQKTIQHSYLSMLSEK